MKLKKNLSKYGGPICTGMAIVGFVATTYLVAKKAPVAKKKLEEAEEEKGEDLTVLEKVCVAAQEYAVPIVTGVGTVMCIAGSQIFNDKKQASLTGSYILLDNQFKRYRQELINRHGEQEDTEIRIACAERQYCDFHRTHVEEPDFKFLWHEPITNQWFRAYEREIMDAEYHINRNFILQSMIDIEDYLSFLGIDTSKGSDMEGWTMEDGYMWIDFEHIEKVDKNTGELYYEIATIFPARDFDDEGW